MDQAALNLEEDLSRVGKWCFSHQLLINSGKTKFILLGTRQFIKQLPPINLLGEIIGPVISAKDLGVLIDSHLTFDFHIAEVVSSCQINRVNKCFNQETLLLIISALVMNKLLCCSTVWANTSAKNIKFLAVQNFACRIVTGTRKYDHITPLTLIMISVNHYS